MMYYFSKAFRFWFLKLNQTLCGDETCPIRDYLGVESYSGKVEERVENYFHLDVVFHPNQQILGHCDLADAIKPTKASESLSK